MKKKIALLLAAVMTLSALPTTAFAASTNSVDVSGVSYKKDTAYNGSSATKGIGTFFDLKIDEAIPAGTQFRVQIKNAEFTNVKDYVFETTDVTGAPYFVEPLKLRNGTEILPFGDANYTTNMGLTMAEMLGSNMTTAASSGMFPAVGGYTPVGTTTEIVTRFNTLFPNLAFPAATLEIAAPTTVGVSTGALTTGTINGKQAWNNVIYTGEKGTFIAAAADNSATNSAPANSVLLKKTGATTAQGVFLKPVAAGKVVRLPIPMTINDVDGEVTIKVVESNGYLSGQEYVIVSTASSGTKTYADDIATGREIIELEDVIIEEKYVSSLTGTGAFELTAPKGYRFRNDATLLNTATDSIKIVPDGELGFGFTETHYFEDGDAQHTRLDVHVSMTSPSKKLKSSIKVQGLVLEPIDDKYIVDGEKLEMSITRYAHNHTTTATTSQVLVFAGYKTDITDDLLDKAGAYIMSKSVASPTTAVKVDAWDYHSDLTGATTNAFYTNAQLADIKTKAVVLYDIKTTSSGKTIIGYDANFNPIYDDSNAAIGELKVTKENFHVATIANWSVTLKVGGVVDLVEGRWENTATNTPNEDQHITKAITIKETEKGAWLADRTTALMFPENVKIRGYEITDNDNFKTTTALPSGLVMLDDNLEKQTNAGVTVNNNYEYNKVNYSALVFKGLDLDTSKISMLELKVYLSVSPDYDKATIEASLGGTAIMVAPDAVTVANVLAPVEVVTKKANVQIGFQEYAVTDVTVKETKAGMLLRDKQLTITVDNDYANGLQITQVNANQVTITGDASLTLVKNSKNAIVFDVNRESRSEAAVITIKDVKVYVDRTVPYGVYDLVVAGTAVYNNKVDYGTTTTSTDDRIAARFTSKGYTAPFINLATEGANSAFKSYVQLSEGTTILVDGKTVELGADSPIYISTVSNSYMVPVRAIAKILGIEDTSIFYDDATKTASITTTNRTVQFTAGSSTMTVYTNGAPASQTMLTNGTTVFAENKEFVPGVGRMYVPFRAMGDAFGITVGYDEASKTATYNAPTTAE